MIELRSHCHLYRLSWLSCMCLTEDNELLPPIQFQDVDPQSSRCRLADVLLPTKSYLSVVPNSFAVCTSEASLAKYRELEVEVPLNSGFVASDPWSHVDSFGFFWVLLGFFCEVPPKRPLIEDAMLPLLVVLSPNPNHPLIPLVRPGERSFSVMSLRQRLVSPERKFNSAQQKVCCL